MSMPDIAAQKINAMMALFNATRNKVILLATQLKAHLTNTNNPHRVDKFDVGLGKVQNFAPAKKAQAVAGKNNNTVMTPVRVEQYMEANIYTPLTQLFDDTINDLDS